MSGPRDPAGAAGVVAPAYVMGRQHGHHGHGKRHHRHHHGHRNHGHRHHGHRNRRPHARARHIARRLLRRFHWGPVQFRYLNWLWERESGWNRFASNPSSGAYGIPQATPGSVMASAGPHWRTSAHTQIIWGMRYIRGRYRRPQRAWEHECSYGWY